MDRVKHDIPLEYKGVPVEELATRQVLRYGEQTPDWDAFADSQTDGGRRAQFRLIGAGGSGKPDAKALTPGGFTLSILIVPPGQGGAPHTHEVEEAFFVLDGELTVYFQDENGKRASTKLGRYDVVSCPAGIPHGFVNESNDDVYMQVMIGTGKPGPVGFIDKDIYAEEVDRLATRAGAAAK